MVTKIHTLKNSNAEADTSNIEEEIDKLVYELYGLSEEEINVVEGKNWDYDRINYNNC